MTNEQYLIASYFLVGLLTLGLGVAIALWLRRAFMEVTDTLPSRHLGGILRRLFSIGIILPTFAGFLSVSFYSCEKPTYEKIIADRAYLVAKNHEQISAALVNSVFAVLGWDIVVLAALFITRQRRSNSTSSSPAKK